MFGKSIFFACSVFVCLVKADYPSVVLPDPHLLIISTIDVNSTSLANVLLGGAPDCKDCLTDVCTNDTLTPCTTKFGVSKWVGSSTNVSVLQASSFGEPGGYVKVRNMVDVIKNFLKTNNQFLIVVNSSIHKTQDIFDTNLDQVLSHLGAVFGRDFWSRVVLGATNWHYDIDSMIGRNQTGKNEEWWTDIMSSTIQKRFGVSVNMTAVFIDADAKLSENLGDPLQSEAFLIESTKLLDLMKNTISMEMNTLEERNDDLQNTINTTLTNMEVKIENLLSDMTAAQDDIIDNGIDISYVKGVVALNQIDIEDHGNSIGNINGNIADIMETSNFVKELFQKQGFECINDIVLKIAGNITSVNYPANYPNMYSSGVIECSFTLVPDAGRSVNIEFVYFQTVNSNDYLEITPNGNETLKYSGTSIPPTTTYELDQSVYILFHTQSNHMYDYDDIYKFNAMFTLI